MKMRYKHISISSIVLAVCIQLILCVRIPPNPCPDVFQYYQDQQGRIYGEATVPYDNALRLVFSVNASFVGKFNTKTELKIKMVTKLHEFQNTRNVIYDIFFPFTNVIPKITSVQYNGQIFCSGPGEPVIPGEPGITNVWSEHTFVMSGRPQGYYPPPSSVEEPDLSDSDIPVKNPGETLTHKTTTTTTTTTTTSRPWTPPRQPTRPKPTQPPTQPPTQWTPPMQWITPATDKQTEPQPVWTSPSETADIDGLIQTLFTRPNQVTTPEPPATFTSPSVTTNEEFKCGVPNNDVPNNYIVPLILGATETTPGQYPWLVALFMKNGKKYDYKCTANLVSDNHILTAARCIQYLNIQIVKTEDIFLIMGTNSLENWNSKGVITRKARKVDVHPAFKQNSKSAHGDIAVILMNRPVQFSNVLRPVCLWKSSTDLYPLINQMGVVAGFGQDEDSQSNGLKHVLRAKRADMPIVSQTECWTSPLGFKDVTSDKTFCTKSHDGLTGPCIGDSGAGFFVEINGVYYLRGITSIVYTENGRCDLSTKYSVFCDVAKFQDWIKSNMI